MRLLAVLGAIAVLMLTGSCVAAADAFDRYPAPPVNVDKNHVHLRAKVREGTPGLRKQAKRRTPSSDFRPYYPHNATPNHPRFTEWRDATSNCPEDGRIMECYARYSDLLLPIDGRPSRYRPPSRDQVRDIAREAILTMDLPLPTPRIGPDPSMNRWNKAIVGHPLWLWSDGPRTVTASTRQHGVPLRLSATLHDITFTMGDGHTVTCSDFQPYPASIAPGTPSPTCGHRYKTESPPTSAYTVTGTARWTIQWSALSYSGTITATVEDEIQLHVTSLQAIVTG